MLVLIICLLCLGYFAPLSTVFMHRSQSARALATSGDNWHNDAVPTTENLLLRLVRTATLGNVERFLIKEQCTGRGFTPKVLTQALVESMQNPHDACGIAELLIAQGAPVNLHAATRRGNAALVELLLEHGTDPNTQNAAGNTPLHIATKKAPHLIETLLQAGADPTIRNNAERTARDCASEQYKAIIDACQAENSSYADRLERMTHELLSSGDDHIEQFYNYLLDVPH